MYVEQLALSNFRSYPSLDLKFDPGVTVFIGSNGLGKTNIVEALGYVASLSSHRVSSDAPLLAVGADQAIVRASLVRGNQKLRVEIELNKGKGNRASINRANPVRASSILGLCRTVLFAPEDLALVKGDPQNRRRFLDEVLQSLHPPYAAVRSDFDRALKQRNALLKSVRSQRFSRRSSGEDTATVESTLSVWDAQISRFAAQITLSRLRLLDQLGPLASAAYNRLTDGSKEVTLRYLSSLTGFDEDLMHPPELAPDLANQSEEDLVHAYLKAYETSRAREFERGVTLIGPHRDDVEISLGQTLAKGYASHGETWSTALALRLATYDVFKADMPAAGMEPILILDDVFAELDAKRRTRLVSLLDGAEQVFITAAVLEDIPQGLDGAQYIVSAPGVVDTVSSDIANSEAQNHV